MRLNGMRTRLDLDLNLILGPKLCPEHNNKLPIIISKKFLDPLK